jgi:methionine sulfoxide reductase heme-binding subunit
VVTSAQALWYLTRGSGVVALLLLTATTSIGVVTANRWRSERWPRFAVADLHRNLTLLALVFIGTHVGTTIADGYAPIGIKDILIPFLSQYRPVWLGLGALALDLLLALTITSLLRKHIGYRTWRALHWAAYATWPLALAHGLGSGSDARLGWMAALSFACLGIVVVTVAARLVRSGSAGLQLAAGAATFAVAILLATWYRGGPAKQGWAARAGTPASLLKTSGDASSTTQLAARTTAVRTVHAFAGRLVGRMSSSGPDSAGDAAIAIAVAVRGSEPGLVRLTLWGTALESGGLAMSRSQVTFEDAATGVVSSGTIVGLNGNRVVADVTSPSGSRLRLTLVLGINSNAGTVTGTIHSAVVSGSE